MTGARECGTCHLSKPPEAFPDALGAALAPRTTAHLAGGHAGTLAKFNGLCPYCSKRIVANRSHVVALEVPIRPRIARDEDGYHVTSADDGGFYRRDGRAPDLKPRRWTHEACWKRHIDHDQKGG